MFVTCGSCSSHSHCLNSTRFFSFSFHMSCAFVYVRYNSAIVERLQENVISQMVIQDGCLYPKCVFIPQIDIPDGYDIREGYPRSISRSQVAIYVTDRYSRTMRYSERMRPMNSYITDNVAIWWKAAGTGCQPIHLNYVIYLSESCYDRWGGMFDSTKK